MKLTIKIIAAGAAALSLATAGVVFAHPGMGQGQGMGPGMGMGMGMGMQGGMGMGVRGPEAAAAVGARLDAVKTELKITAAQETAWQNFAAVMQQQAAARDAMRAQMQAQMHGQPGTQAPNASPADRSAHYEAMSQFRDAHLAARSAALKDLYAVLTPEQKVIAEQRFAPMSGHWMAGRWQAK